MGKPPTKKSILTRGIQIITVLAPCIMDGMSATEIASKTGFSLAAVCRDLDALAEVAWVVKENGRWKLTNRPIALANACDMALKNAKKRMDDINRNVVARAHQMLEDMNGEQ